jgi:hypothetical protein
MSCHLSASSAANAPRMPSYIIVTLSFVNPASFIGRPQKNPNVNRT